MSYTHLMASFPGNLAKPAPERWNHSGCWWIYCDIIYC